MKALLILLFVSLPLAARAESYPSLWESIDPDLQAGLEQLLKQHGLWQQVKGKRLALAVVDLKDPRHPRVGAVNGDRMMYAASLPKIAILLGAFVEMERGELEPDDRLWTDLHRMIRNSDNAAATRVLRRLGKERLLEILQDEEWALYDPGHGGGLWVGKEYSKGAAYRRDPLANLSHGATAMQVARFYYLLETERLVNPQLTEKMKEILVAPAIRHKFVYGLRGLSGARFYRKSGTWRTFHADSLLVEEKDRKYILVALARHEEGGRWISELAMPLRTLIFRGR